MLENKFLDLMKRMAIAGHSLRKDIASISQDLELLKEDLGKFNILVDELFLSPAFSRFDMVTDVKIIKVDE